MVQYTPFRFWRQNRSQVAFGLSSVRDDDDETVLFGGGDVL